LSRVLKLEIIIFSSSKKERSIFEVFLFLLLVFYGDYIMPIRPEIDTIENINIEPAPTDGRINLLLSRRENLTLTDGFKNLERMIVNIDPNRS
jgi:hypothetical protein